MVQIIYLFKINQNLLFRNRDKRIHFNYVVVLTMSTTKEEEREFLDLCRDGDLESVEYLLEENPTLIDSSNYGMTNNSMFSH